MLPTPSSFLFTCDLSNRSTLFLPCTLLLSTNNAKKGLTGQDHSREVVWARRSKPRVLPRKGDEMNEEKKEICLSKKVEIDDCVR